MSDSHDHWYIRNGGRCVICNAPYYAKRGTMEKTHLKHMETIARLEQELDRANARIEEIAAGRERAEQKATRAEIELGYIKALFGAVGDETAFDAAKRFMHESKKISDALDALRAESFHTAILDECVHCGHSKMAHSTRGCRQPMRHGRCDCDGFLPKLNVR